MSDGTKGMSASVDASREKALSERREFLRKTGKAALVAPAVALLLSAASKQAVAAVSGCPPGTTVGGQCDQVP